MQHATPQADDRPIVLVVDDSQDVHRLLKARLRTEEIELIAANSGAQGLEMARAGSPSLMLLDLDMPAMDGFQVLRALKDDPKTVHLPVIVLSGLQSAQDKVTAFDLGAMDYVTKPFDLTELRVRIRAALRLHRLLAMLAERAHVDGLTGLWNRAHFDKRWPDEVALCARHKRPLSLAIFDVDHFKSVNDTFGHPAGDAVLQGFARLLQRECRQTDIACRFGGEEFIVIMPETPPQHAAIVCDRIRVALEAMNWPRHPDRKITVSAGVVGAAAGAVPAPEEWVEKADKNLYQSKHGGRNRVTTTDLAAATETLALAS